MVHPESGGSRRYRPSPSLVISLLALIVACAGTAFAAGLITTKEIKDPQQITMKNGRPAIQGTCPDCGTKIFKIGKMEA